MEAIENIITVTEIEKENQSEIRRMERETSIYETETEIDTVKPYQDNNEQLNFTYSASDRKVSWYLDSVLG